MRVFRRPRSQTSKDKRSGATLVEAAVILPWFFMFVFAFIEFGHVFMTIHVLNGAAKQAARAGVGDNSTTAKVENEARRILGGLLGPDTPYQLKVYNGSKFDEPDFDQADLAQMSEDPNLFYGTDSPTDYGSLGKADLSTYEPRQLFIVRVSVSYNDVGILGPRWLSGLRLYGQSVMRHE